MPTSVFGFSSWLTLSFFAFTSFSLFPCFADAMRFENHEIFRSVIEVLVDRCERVLAESQEYARGSSASPSRVSSPGSRKMTPYRGKPAAPVVSSSQMCHLKV